MLSLRYALRSLARAPGFSLSVFGSLAVCLGPNAAILSVLYALVLKSLPFPAPAQLVAIVNVGEKSGGQLLPSSTPQFVDFRAHADRFEELAGVRTDTFTIESDDAPLRLPGAAICGNFFRVLDVRPILGRFFTSEEEVAGSDHVLVLTQSFWERQFNTDPAVLGRRLRIAGQLYTVVGVAPRSVESLNPATALFLPYVPAASKFDPQARYRGDLALYGRLTPGTTPAAARDQLAALENAFEKNTATPAMRVFMANAGFRVAVAPLRPGNIIAEKDSLWLLQGGALLVLLIGGVNVGNLFLARLNAKRPELAIRVALGAGRAALLRQLLVESFLLTGAATVAGLVFAVAALGVFNRYLPLLLPAAPPVTLDPVIAGVMVAVAFALALLLGFFPLHLLWRGGLRVDESRAASSGGRSRAVSSALVTAQVAIAVVLLVGAGLLLRSFAKVMAVNPGFDAAHVVQARLTLPARYARAADNVGMQHRIVEAFQTVPGVEHVAESLDSLIVSNLRPVPFSLRGAPNTDAESQPLIHINAVSPDFFATMGMRVLAGRGFTDAEDFAKNPVAIVDETFAQKYFPGRIVEGQEIYLSRGFPLGVDAWPRIVGVVNRANLTGLDSHDDLPIVYVPLVGFRTSSFEVLVRSTRPTADLLRDLRVTLAVLDPATPLYGAGSLEARFNELLAARRGLTLLIAAFAGLALLLAAIGLYGVLAYDVSQRTREIGIRGAIGASPRQIVVLILCQGLGRTVFGLVAGLIGAVWLTRYLNALLFGLGSVDAISYVAVCALLTGVALLACWLPARRAAKIDPIVALRSE